MNDGNTIKGKDVKKPFCIEQEDRDRIYFDLNAASPEGKNGEDEYFKTPFEAIFHNADDYIFLSRRDETGMICYTDINPAGRNLMKRMGLEKKDICLGDIYQGPELSISLFNYELCEATRKTVTFLKEIALPDKTLWLQISVCPYVERGKSVSAASRRTKQNFLQKKIKFRIGKPNIKRCFIISTTRFII